MNYASLGDRAQTYQSRSHNVQIKTDLQRLAQELASGRKTDISTVGTGDFSSIVSIESSLTSLLAYKTATTEAALVASTAQTVLGTIQDTSVELGSTLLTASSSENTTLIQTATTDAKLRFESAISSLNTRFADRSVFSGQATDSPALADIDTIMNSIQLSIAGETTAAGVASVVDNWFDNPGGGYDTVAYLGSDTPLSTFRLSENDGATISMTASDQEFRETLKGFALAALVADNALSGNDSERVALTQLAGEKLLSAGSGLTDLRANLGTTEARIESISVQNTAEMAVLEIAKTDITEIDPYAVATEIEALSTQLELLYTLTARMSRLSLADYL